MGSLMPGWGNIEPGVPPKDMREEAPEPQGYFAKLEWSRSMRREGAGAAGALDRKASLDRSSSLTVGRHSSLGFSRQTSMMPAQAEQPHHEFSGRMSAPLARKSLPSASGSPRYHGTDWETELRTLKVGKRESVDLPRTTTDMARSVGSSGGATSPTSWWAQLESGKYNAGAPPDEEMPPHDKLRRGGSVRLDLPNGASLHIH